MMSQTQLLIKNYAVFAFICGWNLGWKFIAAPMLFFMGVVASSVITTFEKQVSIYFGYESSIEFCSYTIDQMYKILSYLKKQQLSQKQDNIIQETKVEEQIQKQDNIVQETKVEEQIQKQDNHVQENQK